MTHIYYFWYCVACGHRNSVEKVICWFCKRERQKEE